jgi:hypothetical protein
MSITIKNPSLYLITEQLGKLLPDDIKNKIILLLLGIKEKNTQIIGQKSITQHFLRLNSGHQYEINLQEGSVQYAIMCEIKIAQFDQANSKKKALGVIKTIKKYLHLLDARFKQRHKLLF